MKSIALVLLVFLLFFLSKSRAQTASTQPASKFYSPLLKEKMAAGSHVSDGDKRNDLPGTKEVPQKVKDMGAGHQSSSDKKSLPGTAAVDREKINARNKKYLTTLPK